MRHAIIPIGLVLCGCGGPNAPSETRGETTPTRAAPEDAREVRILSAAKLTVAINKCESPSQLFKSYRDDQTIVDVPAVCQSGTTPSKIQVDVKVTGDLHEALSAFAPVSQQTFTLNMKETRSRRMERPPLFVTGDCAWSDYGGSEFYPRSAVKFEVTSLIDEQEINGIEFENGVEIRSEVNAADGQTVTFKKGLAFSKTDFPIDCSASHTIKATGTTAWTDGLNEENLPGMLEVTLTPVN